MSGGGVERRAKIRDQLRDFYQFDASPQKRVESESRKSHGGPPEMDLDSEQFDVQAYTTQLLQKESLKGLVQTDTELLRRIRSLDGELQDLVYKNYAKFISATDTIRQMKENVSDMESKLKALSANVTHIDEVSKVVSTSLQGHREKLEETLAVNKMLRKVHFLMELPERMKRFVKSEQLHLAVRFWIAGDQVLTKHQGVSTFEKTRIECSDIAKGLYQSLERNLMQLSSSNIAADPDVSNTARKLIEDMRLMRSTSIFHGETMSGGSEKEFYAQILRSMLKMVEDDFVAQVDRCHKRQEDITESFRRSFTAPDAPRPADPRLVEQPFALLTAQIRELAQELKMAFAVFATSKERCLDIVNPASPSDPRPSGGGSALDASLMATGDKAATLLLTCAPRFMSDVISISGLVIEAVLRSVDFPVLSTKDTLVTLLGHISKQFKAFTSALRAVATNIRGTPDAALQPHIDDAASQVLKTFTAVLDQQLAAALQTNLNAPKDDRFYLVVALLSRFGVKYLMTDMATAVNLPDTNSYRILLVELGKRAIQVYVTTKGQRMTAILVSSMGLHSREAASISPTAPSPAVVALLTELKSNYELLDTWFPTETKHSRVPSGGSALSRNSGSELPSAKQSGANSSTIKGAGALMLYPQITFQRRDRSSSLLSDIDRALSKASSTIHTIPVAIEASHINECLLVFIAKAVTEHMRSLPFLVNNSFQQLQMDATTVVACVHHWMEVGGMLRKDIIPLALWTEAATCAYERVSPASARSALPHPVIEKLIASVCESFVIQSIVAPVVAAPGQVPQA